MCKPLGPVLVRHSKQTLLLFTWKYGGRELKLHGLKRRLVSSQAGTNCPRAFPVPLLFCGVFQSLPLSVLNDCLSFSGVSRILSSFKQTWDFFLSPLVLNKWDSFFYQGDFSLKLKITAATENAYHSICQVDKCHQWCHPLDPPSRTLLHSSIRLCMVPSHWPGLKTEFQKGLHQQNKQQDNTDPPLHSAWVNRAS